MGEFIVQWYDFATSRWKKFGFSEDDRKTAKAKAHDLYKMKRGKISVRVRQEVTICELLKEESK